MDDVCFLLHSYKTEERQGLWSLQSLKYLSSDPSKFASSCHRGYWRQNMKGAWVLDHQDEEKGLTRNIHFLI